MWDTTVRILFISHSCLHTCTVVSHFTYSFWCDGRHTPTDHIIWHITVYQCVIKVQSWCSPWHKLTCTWLHDLLYMYSNGILFYHFSEHQVLDYPPTNMKDQWQNGLSRNAGLLVKFCRSCSLVLFSSSLHLGVLLLLVFVFIFSGQHF